MTGLDPRNPLALGKHGLGLDAGAGVHQVVAEEDLRRSCAGGTVLGHVVACKDYSVSLDAPLTQIVHSGQETTLGDMTSFKWDKVAVILPYGIIDLSEIRGIPRRVDKIIRNQDLFDGTTVLIFSLDGNFVYYSEVEVGKTDSLGLKTGIYTPDTIIPIKQQ